MTQALSSRFIESTKSRARRLASSRRERLPSATSLVAIEAERSMRMTVSFPAPGLTFQIGRMSARQRRMRSRSWRRRRRFLRSFWNGALTWRSWTAFFQRRVEETGISRRRSLRK
jgi:hypothetical protein